MKTRKLPGVGGLSPASSGLGAGAMSFPRAVMSRLRSGYCVGVMDEGSDEVVTPASQGQVGGVALPEMGVMDEGCDEVVALASQGLGGGVALPEVGVMGERALVAGLRNWAVRRGLEFAVEGDGVVVVGNAGCRLVVMPGAMGSLSCLRVMGTEVVRISLGCYLAAVCADWKWMPDEGELWIVRAADMGVLDIAMGGDVSWLGDALRLQLELRRGWEVLLRLEGLDGVRAAGIRRRCWSGDIGWMREVEAWEAEM